MQIVGKEKRMYYVHIDQRVARHHYILDIRRLYLTCILVY
jgi:hypothetical protein